MKIVVCGSVNFAHEMKDVREQLLAKGHDVVLPASIAEESLETFDDAARMKKREDYLAAKPRYTIGHFDEIKEGDAILVVNPEKRGIENYVGGATFAEIMLAFYYQKKIFFWNPIPTDERLAPYADEIASVSPIVVNQNPDLIR
jgi:hypothetical protein